MRRGFWLRALFGLFTAVVGVGIAWAGYALISPERAGLKGLPPEVGLLPFDRGFWAFALVLLGAATMLKALPHPFWTQGGARSAISPRRAAQAPPMDLPPAQTELMEAQSTATPLKAVVEEDPTPAADEHTEAAHHPTNDSEAALEAPHPTPF